MKSISMHGLIIITNISQHKTILNYKCYFSILNFKNPKYLKVKNVTILLVYLFFFVCYFFHFTFDNRHLGTNTHSL